MNYEYMTASNQLGEDDQIIEKQLNALGCAGWELVTVIIRAGLTVTWILKRQLQRGKQTWQKTENGRAPWRKKHGPTAA